MKTIKTTHIDNGGHGYYSVSKKDITLLGIADKISSYSGHTLNRVYLEEDCDGTLLYNRAKELGIAIVAKSSYNPKFTHSHNYKAALFAWTPKTGEKIMVGKDEFSICKIDGANCLFLTSRAGKKYKIPEHKIFFYVTAIIKD